MERAPCRLAALGLVNALGGCAERVWPGLLAGETSRLSWRDDLVPGRDLLVGAVTDPLPDIPPALARYACRNNAMALAGLVQIEAAVRNAVDTFGASRVGPSARLVWAW
jgi:3-oxoacyl-[acyl-carrier-protein] synthase-1